MTNRTLAPAAHEEKQSFMSEHNHPTVHKPVTTAETHAEQPGGGGDSRWRELYSTEDYWAIWLGLAITACGLCIFLPRPPVGMQATIEASNATMAREAEATPFRTIAWYKAQDAKARLKGTNNHVAKLIKEFTSKPHEWKNNPLESFVVTEAQAEKRKENAQVKWDAANDKANAAETAAQTAEDAARAAGFEDDRLNTKAIAAIAEWRNASRDASAAGKKLEAAKPINLFGHLATFGLGILVLFGIGVRSMGRSFWKFALGFVFVFLIAVLAQTLAAQSTICKAYGLGYALWAIVFGMLISNTIGTPGWVKPAVLTEYFIKTGLVLLGAEILFGKIVAIGIPGIFVAWVVTPIVLVTTYIFGQKVLKMSSKTLNITISSDMSVCGVSAAIATAAACRASKEELTLAVGLSLVFTTIMMVVMPTFIKAVGLPEILGGAWMGGTIDATGAVAAAGEFLGPDALYVAATIKMIQNMLIGVIAFGVATYWCLRVVREADRHVDAMEIWYRFPKFVLGFIGVSVVFSIIYAQMGSDVGYTLIDNGVIGGLTKSLRGWFFCLAFVSIGLATNFRELAHHFKGGKPLILYVCGQSLNLCLTLLVAYVMFYLVFPQITAQI